MELLDESIVSKHVRNVYYQQQRAATHQDIVGELDCTAMNVGDILRRIENTLVDETEITDIANIATEERTVR